MPDGVQIACNQCSGDNYLCSSETDTGALEYCYPNVTTCSIGKLTDRTNSQVVWGISCGVGEVDVDGTVCQEFSTQTADGYVCTCNTSWCNSIDQVGGGVFADKHSDNQTPLQSQGKQMIARAEQGITGSGLNCHVCSGSSNLCTNSTDQGTLIDCGEGVVTCLIATSKSVVLVLKFSSTFNNLGQSVRQYVPPFVSQQFMSTYMKYLIYVL